MQTPDGPRSTLGALVLLALATAATLAALTAVFAARGLHHAARLGGKGIATLALGVSIILGLAPVLLLVAIGLAGGAGLPGYLGDAVRKFVFESGPVSRQRWLTAERRYRRS